MISDIIKYIFVLLSVLGCANNDQLNKSSDTNDVNSDNKQIELLEKDPLKIKTKDYSGSSSTQFPNEIFNMLNIEILLLDHTKFDSIPADISKLKHLQYLSISESNVSYVSDELFKLKELEYLNLIGNEIHTIPDKFDQLKSLRTLALCNNDLEYFPMSISQVKNLEQLCVQVPVNSNLCDLFGSNTNLSRLELSPISWDKVFDEVQKSELKMCLPNTVIIW